MPDPNRERWEREAQEWLDSYFGPTSTLFQESIATARDAFVAACKKYAPRLLPISGAEASALIERFWSFQNAHWSREHKRIVAWFYPPPPGGDE